MGTVSMKLGSMCKYCFFYCLLMLMYKYHKVDGEQQPNQLLAEVRVEQPRVRIIWCLVASRIVDLEWFCLDPDPTCQWMRSSLVWMRSSLVWMRSSLVLMRSSQVFRASDCQCTSCNGPGFDPSIRRYSGIWGAADEAVYVKEKKKKIPLYFPGCPDTFPILP